jgi:general secretion pathway protein D
MIKPPLFTFCSLIAILAINPAFAGQIPSGSVPNSVQGIAEREISRRNDQVSRAQQAIAEGDKAMRVRDYEVAVQQYKSAADILTESPVTHQLRCAAVERYCDASVKLAQQRIAEGRYAEAEAAAKAVLADVYNPRCSEALTLLAHLEEPGYYNKTITPKFHANVEQVKAWFVEAQGFYDTGRYDLAMKRYDQILGIDPTNAAAREGQIKVNLARTEYTEKAYEEARSRQLWKVSHAWESPVRKYGAARGGTVLSSAQAASSTAAIQNKLNNIIIPKVEFKDATVREAIEFLKQKSAELDIRENDRSRRGVNIVLQLDTPNGVPTAAPAAPVDPATAAAPAIPGIDSAATTAAAAPVSGINPADARITLSLNNMPLAEVLRYITTLAGLKVKIDQYAVAIVPITVITDQLITKEYKVPPGAFQNAVNSGGGASAAPTARGGTGSNGMITGNNIGTRILAKDYFAGQGVQFPPGAAANFIPTSSRLIVKNTQDNLDLIDVIVEALNGTVPLQVDIEAKFVEITQKNLKELSFDWTLGQFNLPGSSRVFGGGGNTAANPEHFTFIDPTTGAVVGGNNLTAGNRSGTGMSSAISANAIDSLLFPSSTATAVAPGVLSMAGVFTDPQFQVVMRALNQKKGVDLLSSPRVTTKSGQRATIEIVREFKYPTEYNPPQVPTSSGSSSGSVIAVTPTTPTAFEVRNTGVSLEVEPVVGADGSTIDLNLVPQVTEFEGFINYGTPIYASNGINTSTTPLTLNVINQPIFSTRKVSTSVSVWDGQTVMLGGLMREDVQKVEDKVPFLGDIPYVGRLFRSSVDQHQKRNLVIFVTARLINPAGDPVNAMDEDKDEVTESVGPVPSALGAPEAESLLPTK